MQVTSYELCQQICDDYAIDSHQKYKTYMTEYAIKNGKRKINASSCATIVDKEGIEHSYMLNMAPAVRNEEKLLDFDHIYVIAAKGLKKVLEEAGITLKSEKCRICEGGGWYSEGRRYHYKDNYCEIN